MVFETESILEFAVSNNVVLAENLEHGNPILWDSGDVGSTLETYDSSEEVGMSLVGVAQEDLSHNVFLLSVKVNELEDMITNIC